MQLDIEFEYDIDESIVVEAMFEQSEDHDVTFDRIFHDNYDRVRAALTYLKDEAARSPSFKEKLKQDFGWNIQS